jgi:uncharacterized protein (TIGR02996 family)
MTPTDAFLPDICANPDDDTLRLIDADYLDERGDPRGEFIRVQIDLARLPDHLHSYVAGGKRRVTPPVRPPVDSASWETAQPFPLTAPTPTA